MEMYSGTPAMEVDPVAEWAAPGGETGLEEPMWQLGLGGGPESYPERPDEPDCIYYLRTGFCGYGNRCRFNHPRDRSMAMGVLRVGGGDYPERPGQPICQYYMRTGMCKFGASCKYNHPKQGVGSSAPVTLNFYGYPMRPGEKECSYYVKTGAIHETMVKVSAYILGEYSHLLARRPGCSPKEIFSIIHEKLPTVS